MIKNIKEIREELKNWNITKVLAEDKYSIRKKDVYQYVHPNNSKLQTHAHYYNTKWEAYVELLRHLNYFDFEVQKTSYNYRYKVYDKLSHNYIAAGMGLSGINYLTTLDSDGVFIFEKFIKHIIDVPKKGIWVRKNAYDELVSIVGSDFYMFPYLLPNQTGIVLECEKSMGTTVDKMIEHKDGEFTLNGQPVKLGRILKALNPCAKDEAIEKIVSKHKTRHVIDTTRVQVSDDIGKIYNISSCGGSCMANEPHSWFEIYKDIKSRIAYILKDNNKLEARALIHDVIDEKGNEHTVLDRIFYDTENSKLTLKQWRKEQGMTRLSLMDTDARSKHPIESTYYRVPYVDNLKEVVSIGGEYHLATDAGTFGSYIDVLQDTGGGSSDGVIVEGLGENGVWVVDWEETIHIDDAYFCETDCEYYGSYDRLAYIDGCGYYHEDDDKVAFDEETGQYDFTENLKYCYHEGIHTSSEDYIMVGAGNEEGEHRHIDDVTYAEDVGEYVVSDEVKYIEDIEKYWYHFEDAVEHSDGKLYSYEEEEEEEEI